MSLLCLENGFKRSRRPGGENKAQGGVRSATALLQSSGLIILVPEHAKAQILSLTLPPSSQPHTNGGMDMDGESSADKRCSLVSCSGVIFNLNACKLCVSLYSSLCGFIFRSLPPSFHSFITSASCTSVAVRGDERVQSRVFITGK